MSLVPLFVAVVLALVVSLLLTRLMLVLAPKLGLMDEPGEARRIHKAAVPRAGGLAIWLTFLLVAGSGVFCGFFTGGDLSGHWLTAFVAASGILIGAGLVDDRWGLNAWMKLGAHVLAPTVYFLLHPVDIGVFPESWPVILDFVVFVGWVVVLINAFNLIDGLDGLCGGLAAVSLFTLGGLAWINGRQDVAVLLLAMGGAVLGFLRYNINPAKIFLGDAGSMLLGFFLATLATEAVGRKAVIGVMMLPIAVAGVPLLDVFLAVWRRSSRKAVRRLMGETGEIGLFEADKEHLHHRLLDKSQSQRKVAMILQGIAVLFSLFAFLPMLFGEQLMSVSLVAFLLIGLVGARTLAQVEIEQTGHIVHMAVKLPVRRRMMGAIMFVYDVFALSLAVVAAVMIETNLMVRGEALGAFLRFGMMFVVLSLVGLRMMRVHQRVWVRATMRDLITLQLWLGVSALAAFSIFSVAYATLEWTALRVAMMSLVFAGGAICMPRVALDVVREIGLDARHRRADVSSGLEVGSFGKVLVLGAGDLGALFLEHLKSSGHNHYPGMHVRGFLDEEKCLHGRRVRSFRVFGGLSALPQLVKNEGISGLVMAIDHPKPEMMNELEEMCDRLDLKLYRFGVSLDVEAEAQAESDGKDSVVVRIPQLKVSGGN
ncbi:MAG: hypothetical protein Q7R22_006245 [Verrucomicrobiota bacterium JB025]|nr:hypothetical protein [Verrucomicrobiota bacterium JB025]